MSLGFYDAVDTLLKIGLGAIISSISTYKITRMTITNDANKESRKHKIQLLEDICIKVDKYYSSRLTFLNVIGGAYPSKLISENEPISDEMTHYLREYDNKFIDRLADLRSAIVRLRLLGLINAVENLNESHKIYNNYREKIVYEKVATKASEVDELCETLTQKKEEFDNYLSKFYSNL